MMTIHLNPELAQELERLATHQGQDLDALVNAAVREFLDASAITDVSAEDIGRTQIELVGELSELEEWRGEGEQAGDAKS